MDDYARSLYVETKSRAKAKGLEFDLDQCDIQIPEFCPVTGVRLIADINGRTNNTPTVDRKDPKKGYIKGNAVVVSWIVNRIKSDQDDPELFEAIARYMRG